MVGFFVVAPYDLFALGSTRGPRAWLVDVSLGLALPPLLPPQQIFKNLVEFELSVQSLQFEALSEVIFFPLHFPNLQFSLSFQMMFVASFATQKFLFPFCNHSSHGLHSSSPRTSVLPRGL